MNTHRKLSMDEIIFENRNQAYGAFVLRRETEKNNLRGLLVALSTGFLLILFFSHFSQFKIHEPIVVDMHPSIIKTIDVEPPKPEPKEILKVKPEPKPSITKAAVLPTTAPQQNTKQFVTMQPVKNEPTNDIPKQAELVNTVVSTHTTPKGSDFVASVNPATTPTSTSTSELLTPETPKTPVKWAEIMPTFPGGQDALMNYLKKELSRYSYSDLEKDGKVIIRFYVDTDGSIKAPEVLRDDVGGWFSKRALDVINKMPRWTPGMQGNKAVRVFYTVPITYKQS